ncbi:mitochondrial inner membrane protease subunit 2 [Vigna unguiculata]|uniref:Mitochondrial inner membrane protease subunit 2 n=2 Tax=Vigna unguiculata TaxID=3917 RepID=A0A4D6MZB0_VIGUN|nr:mitochondrial inner membrane protease subunit 2 [Vigna unguiculata]
MDFRSNNIKNNQENVNSVAPPGRYSSSPGGSCKNQEQRPKFVMPPGGPGLAAGRFLGRNPGKQSNFIHTRHNSSYSVKNQREEEEKVAPLLLCCVLVLDTIELRLHPAMVSLSTWFRYIAHKVDYSVSLGWKNYKAGNITDKEARDIIWKNFFQGRMTYLHWNKGEEMVPAIDGKSVTLVRKLPTADPTRVFVGDVVVLKDPEKPDNYLVRRLTAIEGYEMVSTDENDEPFTLEKDQCWVVAENEKLKAKEANDSRTFGPVQMTDIVGRVIYCLRSAVDHGRVQNSYFGMRKDTPVLEVELDVDEMAKSHKA